MFLADVLLGRGLDFTAGLVIFTVGSQVIDSTKYDHAVGMQGKEVVISQDDAMYPRYVIAFHKNPT